jgi:RNA polymerase sigma-70 factor (ECF subfamily)
MHRLDPQTLPSYTDRLYRAAWALCGSREEAEDLVQETFVKALAKPRVIRGSDLSYLLGGLRNAFVDSLRRADSRPRAVGPIDELTTAAPRSREPEEAAQAQEVFAAIAELPEHFRLALVAVDVVGLSYAEAGRALGAGESTIATRVFRGRETIAEQFKTEATGPRGVVEDDQTVKPRNGTHE